MFCVGPRAGKWEVSWISLWQPQVPQRLSCGPWFSYFASRFYPFRGCFKGTPSGKPRFGELPWSVFVLQVSPESNVGTSSYPELVVWIGSLGVVNVVSHVSTSTK